MIVLNKPRNILFFILNYRLGGQLSGVLAIKDILAQFRISSRVVDPSSDGMGSLAKAREFSELGLLKRILLLSKALRAARRALNLDSNTVLHVVLPTPTFLWILLIFRIPTKRVVIQYEGPCLFFCENLAALRSDFQFILPRLLLNNIFIARAFRYLECPHIVSSAYQRKQLERIGFSRVYEIANFSRIKALTNQKFRTDFHFPHDRIVCAYVGHSFSAKGLSDFVNAFVEAYVERPSLKLIIALSGDGDSSDVLTSLKRIPGDAYELLGAVSVSNLLTAIDWLVLPYRSLLSTTLYPSLLLEAHESMCPLVVSRVPELVDQLNSESDFLRTFKPSDVLALKGILLKVEKRDSLSWKPYLVMPDEQVRLTDLLRVYESVSND